MSKLHKIVATTAFVGTVAVGASQIADADTYTIKSGDTLWDIAVNNGTTVDALMQDNNLSSHLIYPGDKLTYSSSSVEKLAQAKNDGYYTIALGDTLGTVADKFGTSVDNLVELNNLSNPHLVYVGQVIKVDGNAAPKATPAVAQAAPVQAAPVQAAPVAQAAPAVKAAPAAPAAKVAAPAAQTKAAAAPAAKVAAPAAQTKAAAAPVAKAAAPAAQTKAAATTAPAAKAAAPAAQTKAAATTAPAAKAAAPAAQTKAAATTAPAAKAAAPAAQTKAVTTTAPKAETKAAAQTPAPAAQTKAAATTAPAAKAAAPAATTAPKTETKAAAQTPAPAAQTKAAATPAPAAQTKPAATTTPSGSKNAAIYQAALAQVGRYQDCTMLVTNALKSVGINYHDWPAGYMKLGTQVSASQAQAGDLIYYANGGTGLAHIAVYAGNGQAVHGGWLGNQTVVNTANVGSGPVYIRVK